MKRWGVLAALAIAMVAPVYAQKGFVPLFNGKDLKNWKTTSNHWVVENGVIALKDRTDNQEHNDSYLWTAEKYGDFVLEIEYKIPVKEANSGIYLRTSDLNDPVETGIEIQVLHSEPGVPLRRNSAGAVYDLVVPSKNAQKDGVWNKYIITCKGAKISVNLNGETVSEVDLDQYSKLHQNPDGSQNKFTRPLKDFARTGYIGLQDHGLPVWYRNVRIKRL
jgi:hypothetical protein